MVTPGERNNRRLASLDILRGLDLFFLLFLQPAIIALAMAADNPRFDTILYQLDHETWQGFRLWDLVMPLFLFMVGTSMPFALNRYRHNADRGGLYKRIARRFLLLFLLGMVVQGNLLALDAGAIKLYTNTLQAIAVGYVIAAIIMLNFKPALQLVITIMLATVYSIGMALGGDYTPQGNFAYAVDLALLGPLRGDITYTWIWSSLTFGVTVMMGVFAGEMIRTRKSCPDKAIAPLIYSGIGCIAASFIMQHLGEPIIKRLWTTSMTLYSGGWCFLLMAFFFWWIDCKGRGKWLSWLKIYGMNPITAYVIGEVINFRSIVASLSFGLEHIIGEQYYAAWLTIGNSAILFLILWLMYRNKIFLKV